MNPIKFWWDVDTCQYIKPENLSSLNRWQYITLWVFVVVFFGILVALGIWSES